ncbi:helix-turn-helix domain-containing protein [Actinoplanes sp. NBRC 103695]|uniref:winged helix-turn-helix transcriptional regulator n=1 Tax=Actinoplanes sp. NBRC 103695 TaxID=3032202 RepID=UPI0024A605A5|nr:helix-turn-helix domain-containing protein [Actinoplanes sp. NBRC 103695]GLY98737.1 HxlR family transcriptional regulator [Actinoplanes sp. NBRC 103695]
MDDQESTSRVRGDREVTAGDLFSPECPTRQLLDRIGDRWTSMLVKVLAEAHPAERGFAELRRAMPGVSHKMLSQTLRRMIADGLVTRRVEPSVPPRTWYTLTSLGLTLDAPLAAVRAWAEANMPAVREARKIR